MDSKTPSENITEKLTITHDKYFKETFRLKRIAQSFLRRVLPKKTLPYLDLKNLTVESRDFSDDMFKETTADMLYKVPVKGTDEYINFFVLVEHKSYQDYPTIFQLWGSLASKYFCQFSL